MTLSILAMLTAVASAQTEPPVSVAVDCAEIDEAVMRRVIEAELGTLVEPSAGDPDVTHVVVSCEEGVATLTVRDPVTGKSLERHVEIARAPARGRSRLVGLAVTELVAASWVELEVDDEPALPIVERTADPAVVAAARRVVRERTGIHRERPFRLASGFMLRAVGPVETLLLGGSISAAFAPADALSIALDVEIAHADVTVSLGSIDVLSASLSGALLLRAETGPLEWSGGAGVRVGIARFAGHANGASAVERPDVIGPWLGPIAVGRLVLTPFEPALVLFGVEVGFAVIETGGISIARGGSTDVATEGLWLGGQLAVGLSF